MRFTRSLNRFLNGLLMWGLIAFCLLFYPLSVIPAVLAWLIGGTTFINTNNPSCSVSLYLFDLGGWAIESVRTLFFLEDDQHVKD